MKKNYISIFVLFLLLGTTFVKAQVPTNLVVVEIKSGTWCTYCPGASLAADDLIANGDPVAIIENHGGDSFENTASNARNSYYPASGYPTAQFNGGNAFVGGSHTQSVYSSYLPIVNTAKAVMSDFTLGLSYVKTGLNYDVTINMDEVGNYTGTNLKVRLVLTESNVEYNWQGQSHLEFINRAMYPDAAGTTYTGGTATINLNFTANASWDMSNYELIAFVQDDSTRQILQADKITLAEVVGTNNVAVYSVGEILDNCTETITPSLKVKSFGNTDITSMAIDYSINSGATTGTYNWTGTIAFNELHELTLDQIPFTLEDVNTLELNITQVNGSADDDLTNNSTNTTFNRAPIAVDNTVTLELHTDAYGNECRWNFKDSSGTVIANGGPYGNNQTINETLSINADCYTFSIIDTYGDGGGAVYVRDSNNDLLYSTNGVYGSGETQAFKVVTVLTTENEILETVNIYPNPAKGQFTITNATGFNLSVYSILGKKVLTLNNISTNQTIDTSNLAEGTYFVKISSENASKTKKLVVIK